MGGLAGRIPLWAATMGFFAFASAGLPGLSGFVGEFLSLVGTFAVSPLAAAIAAVVMVLGAGYLLFMYGRIVFGEVSEFIAGLGGHVTDMTPVELLTLVPLAVLIVIFGIQPGLLLDLVQGSVEATLESAAAGAPITVGGEVLLIGLGVIVALIVARTVAVALGRRSPPSGAVVEGGAAH